MKLFRKLFGLDFPDPEVGQVWRSQHSGLCIRVTEARIHDTGIMFVSVQHELTEPYLSLTKGARADEFNTISMRYAIGLSQWRARLSEERRVLIRGAGWRLIDLPQPKGATP